MELFNHFLFELGIAFVIDFARGTSFSDAGMEFAANALDRREFLELFSESSFSETTKKELEYLEDEYDQVKNPDQEEENCNRHEKGGSAIRALAALLDEVADA